MSINLVYADSGEVPCYDPSGKYNKYMVDKKWIMKNLLAIPVPLQDSQFTPLQLTL